MPNARPDVIPFICEWLSSKGNKEIKTALDVGCGFGKWGFLMRLYLQVWNPQLTREEYRNWRNLLTVDGIEIFETSITELQNLIYNNIFIGDMRTLIKTVGNYDLIFMGDVLEHVAFCDGQEVLRVAREKAGYVIVTMPDYFCAGRAGMGNNAEIHRYVWRDGEFPDNPKIKHIGAQKVIIYEKTKDKGIPGAA